MHIITIVALLLYTIGVVSKPVSQVLANEDLYNYPDTFFDTETEEDLPIATANTDPTVFPTNNEPEENSFISISPQNTLIAQSNLLPECNSDASLDEVPDYNVYKRTLDHEPHVKRQTCQKRTPTIERPGTQNPNHPSVERGRRLVEDDQVITKPKTDPCKGLERNQHLTCGG